MSPVLVVCIALIMLLLLIALGVPIYLCLGMTGFVGTWMLTDLGTALSFWKTFPYNRAADYTQMVIPMFILMGYFAYAAGLSKEAYGVANKWLGRFPAGIAMATIGASALFGACCGSSVACSATMGRVAIPEMKSRGYNDKVAAGVVAAGGLLGIMIPPSTILVFYASLAECSVGDMLLAGILPGILTAIIFCIGLRIWANYDKTLCPDTVKYPLIEMIKSLRHLWGIAVMFLVLMGGIYGGISTPSEAASLGAVAIFLMMFNKIPKSTWKEEIPKQIAEALKETIKTVGMIFTILICSAMFSVFMTKAQVPAMINTWAMSLPLPPLAIVSMFLLILIPMGMFMDPFSSLVIIVPLTYRVVTQTFGYSVIWYGILMTLMIQVGLLTPPVGLNVYVMKGSCPDLPLEDIFRGSAPFVIMTAVVVLILLFVPEIATALL